MMKTTELLRLNPEKLRCLIRKEWLAVTPEEAVRQRLLAYMTTELGYPASWLCVEKQLKDLPHLQLNSTRRLPKRRVDILCYTIGPAPVNALVPLILIECKAVPITARATRQIIGYNRYVAAPYVCLVNVHEMRFGHFDKESSKYVFGNRFPSYEEISAK